MMLGRMADYMYWIARGMERAENTARLLDSTYQLSLMPAGRAAHKNGDGTKGSNEGDQWNTLMGYVYDDDYFHEHYGKVSSGTMIAYMTLDLENPSSILSNICTVRENARASRHMLTTEVWETVNQTYLEVKGLTYPKLMDIGYSEFFEWVKERSALFRGVMFGTIRRGDAFNFLRLGTFIERADNTGRQLELRAELISHLHDDDWDQALDYYQWGALLRSLSAFKAYREIYGSGIKPRNVLELMILRSDMPRSLHSCMNETSAVLEKLKGNAECTRQAGQMHAEMHYSRIEPIMAKGLSEFIAKFLARNNEIGMQIQKDFMMVV